MLIRLVPLSLATPIVYFAFGSWYRGPDTSPAQHPVPLLIGVVIAIAIVLGPAVLAFAIALRRGHRVAAALGIAAAEIALAAVFVPVLLFVGLVLFGLFGPHDPS